MFKDMDTGLWVCRKHGWEQSTQCEYCLQGESERVTFTLHEFHELLKDHISNFIAWYKSQSKKHHSVWPAEMSEDAWIDEFITYIKEDNYG